MIIELNTVAFETGSSFNIYYIITIDGCNDKDWDITNMVLLKEFIAPIDSFIEIDRVQFPDKVFANSPNSQGTYTLLIYEPGDYRFYFFPDIFNVIPKNIPTEVP